MPLTAQLPPRACTGYEGISSPADPGGFASGACGNGKAKISAISDFAKATQGDFQNQLDSINTCTQDFRKPATGDYRQAVKRDIEAKVQNQLLGGEAVLELDPQRALAQKVHVYHAAGISVKDIAGITDLSTAAVRAFLKAPAPR